MALQRFAKDLVLVERLAAGGMAEVYRGVQTGAGQFQRHVAVKRILPHFAGDDTFRGMFEYEVSLSARFTHPNIVQVYRTGDAEGYLYLVMEFISGKNLAQLLKAATERSLEIPVEVACCVAAEAAKALDYAHGCADDQGRPLNVVHRDVSPQNIMVTYDGHVKVLDFGIARAADRAEFTAQGGQRGKIAYMSPEQASGDPIDRRSDVFGLGVVFYELLTRQKLFSGETFAATARKVLGGSIPPPSLNNPRVANSLDSIVFRALSRDPNERYQTAGELQHDVTIFLHESYPRFVPEEDVAKFMRSTFQEEIAAEQRLLREVRFEDLASPPADGSLPVVIGAEANGPIKAAVLGEPSRPLSRTPSLSQGRPSNPNTTLAQGLTNLATEGSAATPPAPIATPRVDRRMRHLAFAGAGALAILTIAVARWPSATPTATSPLAVQANPKEAPSAPSVLREEGAKLSSVSHRLLLGVCLGAAFAQKGDRGLARAQLDAVAQELPSVESPDDRDRLWQQLAISHAKLGDAATATGMAQHIGSVSLRADALAMVASDPAMARGIKVPEARDSALARLAEKAIEEDELDVAGTLASEVQDESLRAHALGKLAAAMLKAKRREDVVSWLRQVDGLAMAEIYSALAMDAAVRAKKKDAAHWVKAIEPDVVRIRTMAAQAMLQPLGRSRDEQADEALKAATDVSDPRLRAAAISEVLMAVMTHEPVRALGMLEKVGAGEDEPKLRSAIAVALAQSGDLDRAEAVAASIERFPAWSTDALAAIARGWVARGERKRGIEVIRRIAFASQRLPILAEVAVRFGGPPSEVERDALVDALTAHME